MKRLAIFIILMALAGPVWGAGWFGHDSTYSSGGYAFAPDTVVWGNRLAYDQITGTTNEVLESLGVFLQDLNKAESIQVGLYTVSGGNPATLAFACTLAYAANNSWERHVEAVYFPLTADVTYTLAMNSLASFTNKPNIGTYSVSNGTSYDRGISGGLPTTWTHDANFNTRLGLFGFTAIESPTTPSTLTSCSLDSTCNIDGTGTADTSTFNYTKPSQTADSVIIKYSATAQPEWAGNTERYAVAYGAAGAATRLIIQDAAEEYTLYISAWALKTGADPETSDVCWAENTFSQITDTSPPDTVSWYWDLQTPIVRAGVRDTVKIYLPAVTAADYDSLRVQAGEALPASRTAGTNVYADGSPPSEATAIYLSGFEAAATVEGSTQIVRVFLADTAGNWATCRADTITLPWADSSAWFDWQPILTAIAANYALLVDIEDDSSGGGGSSVSAADIWAYDLRADTGVSNMHTAGWRLYHSGDTAQYVYGAGTQLNTIEGYVDALPATFPTNFPDLSITAGTGRVNIGTNYDKTGYALTQAFPSNFSSLKISATGYVSPNLADYAGSLNSAAFASQYWTDMTSIVGTGGGGGGTCEVPESLLAVVPKITDIQTHVDAWASLQFDTLNGRIMIMAAMTDAGGDSIYPAYLMFRPLKSDSTTYAAADALTYGSGSTTYTIIKSFRTLRADAAGTLEFPLLPNTSLSDTTSLYEFKFYFQQSGHQYDEVRTIIAVPDTASTFNPLAP
jgi:hypothetical protein